MTLAPVHFSTLKLIARSPAHYRHALLAPREPSIAMRLGTLVHARVLGGCKRIDIYDGERRGNAWKAYKADHAGQEIATRAEANFAQQIGDLVLADPNASMLFRSPGTTVETEILYDIAGRACSCRPDAFGPGRVAELKVTHDANPATFHWHATRQGWLAQMAWQLDALEAAGHGRADERQAFIVAVEQKPPHVVQVYELQPDAVDFGRRCYRLWWERLMVCEASNVWPGYTQGVAPLSGPPGSEDVSLVVDGEEIGI